MAGRLEIRVDLAACHGARACVRRAPETFALDAQRKVVVAAQPGDADAAIADAVRACPNFALELRRDGARVA